MASEIATAKQRLSGLDVELEAALERHPDAALIRSLPGMGATLSAEFIAEAGAIGRFPTADCARLRRDPLTRRRPIVAWSTRPRSPRLRAPRSRKMMGHGEPSAVGPWAEHASYGVVRPQSGPLVREPHRNRVTPQGDIVAIALRGAWTGNRGCLHRGNDIVRRWASPHWLICSLQFKGCWHEQWVPNRLTWLFFHDEAVAFAAGHRPCALCRRPAYNAYRDAFSGAGLAARFDEMDRQLHNERFDRRTRRRRLHPVGWSELPDGTFVMDHGTPALVFGRHLVAWSAEGYGDRRRRPRSGTAELLTPPSTLTVLQFGYPIQIDARLG